GRSNNASLHLAYEVLAPLIGAHPSGAGDGQVDRATRHRVEGCAAGRLILAPIVKKASRRRVDGLVAVIGDLSRRSRDVPVANLIDLHVGPAAGGSVVRADA